MWQARVLADNVQPMRCVRSVTVFIIFLVTAY